MKNFNLKSQLRPLLKPIEAKGQESKHRQDVAEYQAAICGGNSLFQGNGSLFCSTQAGDVSGRTNNNDNNESSIMKNI